MTGKDAPGRLWTSRWKTHLSLLCGTAAVLGACLIIRCVWGSGEASAQGPLPRIFSKASGSPQRGQPVRATSSDQTPGNAQADGQKKLQVMAVVNADPISRQDLARECLHRYGKDVLESIVNKHLIMQACQQYGIDITEQDVEDEVTRIAGKFGLSTARWLTMLEQERDIAPQQYRREIIWPTLALRRLAAEEIEVTADELKKAFEAEYGVKVKVRMITVSSQQKAETLHAQAVEDPDQFGALAKDHSEDPNSASTRGLIPPIRKHLGDETIERIAFELKEGDISPVIPVANQYLILKCEKHLPETFIAEQHRQDAEDRLRDQIRDQKLRSTASELFQTLQQRSEVVNVYNDPRLQKQRPGVAALVNGRQITIRQLSEECLLRHGPQVLEGEINRKLLLQELDRRNKAVAEQDIDEEIRRAADAYGYLTKEGEPDMDAWLEAVTEGDRDTVELYVRDAVWPSVALKKLVSQQVEVTEEDLEKGFQSNYGERVEVLAIVLSSQRQAQTVWGHARDNPTDHFFGELAHEYSVEPVSRENLGKVPPIRRYGGQPLLEEEAFKLAPGELSGIIAVGDKYIILRCLGRTRPVVGQEDFDTVREELHKDLYEKKLRLAMAQQFDHLKESAQIDNFLAGTSQAGVKPTAAPAKAASPDPAGRQAVPSARRPTGTSRR